MTDTSTVGGLTLPVAPGGANDSLDDPTLLGLLAYLGHWIKESLDGKLSQQEGPTVDGAITDACPVAHRFPWDHKGAFMRHLPGTEAPPLPGLWAWERESQRFEETNVWSALRRTIVVHYVFPELTSPSGMTARHGIVGAVSRIMAKAAERGRNANFGYDGDPLGTPLWRSIGAQSIELMSTSPGYLEMIPGGASAGTGRTNTAGTLHRYYPTLEAVFEVVERVGPDTAEGLDQGDGAVTIAVGDDPADGLDVMERAFVYDDAPDEDD